MVCHTLAVRAPDGPPPATIAVGLVSSSLVMAIELRRGARNIHSRDTKSSDR